MDFGQKIKALRQEKKWSQGDLSEKLSIHREQISSYERGLVVPKTDILMQLAQIFDVSIDYLLFSNEERDRISADIRDRDLMRQFEKLDKMNETDRKLVKDLIEVVVVKNQVYDLVAQKAS